MQKYTILGTALVCGLLASFAILPVKASAHEVTKPDRSPQVAWGDIATVAPGFQNVSRATCPRGYIVSGGGYLLLPTFYPLANFFIPENFAIDPQTWKVTLNNSLANGSNSIKFRAQAICLLSKS